MAQHATTCSTSTVARVLLATLEFTAKGVNRSISVLSIRRSFEMRFSLKLKEYLTPMLYKCRNRRSNVLRRRINHPDRRYLSIRCETISPLQCKKDLCVLFCKKSIILVKKIKITIKIFETKKVHIDPLSMGVMIFC